MAIARVALPVAANRLFDYWLPEGLGVQAGSIVRVTLGRRRAIGVAVEIVDSSPLPPEQVVPIQEVVTELPPLPEDVCSLARFVSAYYQQPIGPCFLDTLPPLGAGHKSRVIDKLAVAPTANADPATKPLELNQEQRAALAATLPVPPRYAPSLLQGVTGSGKTEVYLAAANRVIEAGRQALLLVPEIHLTPQLEQRIAAALPGVRLATLHSAMSAGERRRRWLAVALGDAQLVLGTRLAVFVPLPRLGLIVVDEEHDPSFRQQDGVRYHARDLAIYRARLRDVPVLLGSATPSLETYVHARRGRYRWLKLSRRAKARSTLPSVRLVPSRGQGEDGLGAPLREAIAERLARDEQSLIFINRRGFAPSLLCVACGWKAMCPRCAARLVVHRESGALRCHHCGHAEDIAVACPQCGNRDLLPLGYGTQRLEDAIKHEFAAARVLRVDRDTTRRRGSFATMHREIAAGEVDILVGTQMLAKGHDFPRLTLVGVLGADNALYSADFRATERLFALLEQVAGRAGRGALLGEVLVQTDFPDHPLFVALAKHDFDYFAQALATERRSLGLPPFGHLALLAAEARTRGAVNAFLGRAAARGHAVAGAHGGCEVYPPVEAALARRAGMERGQVLVQSSKRSALQEFLPLWRAALESLGPRTVHWTLEVDPVSLA